MLHFSWSRTLAIAVIMLGLFLFGFWSGNFFSPHQQLDLDAGKTVHNTLVAIDSQGRGVTARLNTLVREGNGLVLVNINNVLADVTIQESARTASKVGASVARVDPRTIDVIFMIEAPAELVSGGSAGSTMALAVMSALMNITPRQDIVMTGEILDDGSISHVESVPEKARAASQINASLFLVPVGDGQEVTGYEREKICNPLKGQPYCEISYVEHTQPLGKIVGVPVLEVETLADAATYYFGYGGDHEATL